MNRETKRRRSGREICRNQSEIRDDFLIALSIVPTHLLTLWTHVNEYCLILYWLMMLFIRPSSQPPPFEGVHQVTEMFTLTSKPVTVLLLLITGMIVFATMNPGIVLWGRRLGFSSFANISTPQIGLFRRAKEKRNSFRDILLHSSSFSFYICILNFYLICVLFFSFFR